MCFGFFILVLNVFLLDRLMCYNILLMHHCTEAEAEAGKP
jgi:hypothetical protein